MNDDRQKRINRTLLLLGLCLPVVILCAALGADPRWGLLPGAAGVAWHAAEMDW